MIFTSQESLERFAENLGKTLSFPAVFELVGDVGAGKTTFTRALARGLGIKTPVTSPSFSISNRYNFVNNSAPAELIHYDFYRLEDPGIMSFELAEALKQKNAIIIVEWGDSIKNLLPVDRTVIKFSIKNDDSRELLFSGKIPDFVKKGEK